MDLYYKYGTFGEDRVCEDVDEVIVMSDVWEIDGVKLVRVDAVHPGGKRESLTAIHPDYYLR